MPWRAPGIRVFEGSQYLPGLVVRSIATRIGVVFWLLAFTLASSASPVAAKNLIGQSFVLPRAHDWKGDFPEVLKRRTLRILAPYSKTLFFVDRGRQMGVEAEFSRALHVWLNSRYKSGKLRVRVTFLPRPAIACWML